MVNNQDKADSIVQQIEDWKQADSSRTVEYTKLSDGFCCRLGEKDLLGQSKGQSSLEQAFEKAKASLAEAQNLKGSWQHIPPSS